MSLYEVVVSKSAAKELSKFPREVNNRIIKSILALKIEPRPQGAKKLKGGSGNWRIRIGDYRVVYSIDDRLCVVDVRKAGNRNDIYD